MDGQAREVAFRKEIEEIVAEAEALTHLQRDRGFRRRFLPRSGRAVIELGVRVPERIGNRLVEEELFDSEKDRSPEEEVVAEPVVDQLVGVLVWDHQAELVELLKESQVRQVGVIRRVKLPVKEE